MKKVLAVVLALILCLGLTIPALAAEEADAAVIHTVSRGDNLSKLALRYYGSRFAWKRIYEANRDIIKNPNLIFIGQKLVIPDAVQTLSADEFQKLLRSDWYNAALGAIYDSTGEMDLSLIFYAGDGGSLTWDELTETETAFLLSRGFSRYSAVQKRSATKLDEILGQYFDTDLKHCAIPESWVYLPDTGCYYSNTNDAYLMQGVTVTKAVRSGEQIRVSYEVEPYRGATDPITGQPVTHAVLTLTQRPDGGYVVISNQNLD